MSASANLIEYSADQCCPRCRSIFAHPKSFHVLTKSDNGFTHYETDELEISYKQGCPFCFFLADGGRVIDIMRARKVQNLVLDIGSRRFSGGPKDYEEGHVDYLVVWYNYGNGRLTQGDFVNASTPIGDPAADEILNRPKQRDPTSDSFYQTAQGWLHDCLHKHEDCVKEHDTLLPTRVLAIGGPSGSNKLHLHQSTESQHGRYAALSYCWGIAQSVITTTHNLEEHVQNLSLNSLPQTLQDAVIVARNLEIPYLWVDALCILQDSPKDKQNEINHMGDVYRNAFLTIVASRAENVDDGFLRPCKSFPEGDKRDVVYRFPYYCRSGEIGEIWLERLHGEPHQQPLNFRGWAMQEAVLAPRALYFQPSSIEWQCFRAGHRHMGKSPRELLIAHDTPENDHSTFDDKLDTTELTLRSEIWESFVEDYTRRRLSLAEDKFPAIQGIASQLNKTWSDIYVAGLWQSNIIRQLVWQRRDQTLHGFKPNQETAVTGPVKPHYRAPSWSWASLDVGIDFPNQPKRFDADAEFLSCDITRTLPTAPMGQILAAKLSIRALCIPIKDAVLNNPLWRWSWHFDDGSQESPDEDRYGEATCLFLGHVIKYATRNDGSGESDRQAAGLVVVPVQERGAAAAQGVRTWKRVGMFFISEPGFYRYNDGRMPCKEGKGTRIRVFDII